MACLLFINSVNDGIVFYLPRHTYIPNIQNWCYFTVCENKLLIKKLLINPSLGSVIYRNGSKDPV